jgi:hypothetical protein
VKCGLVQLSWLISAGGWLWAITSIGPSAARRVLRSPEHLQQPSGEANVSPPRIFFHEPSVLHYPPPPPRRCFSATLAWAGEQQHGVRVL